VTNYTLPLFFWRQFEIIAAIAARAGTRPRPELGYSAIPAEMAGDWISLIQMRACAYVAYRLSG
jgi:hypothetical protein